MIWEAWCAHTQLLWHVWIRSTRMSQAFFFFWGTWCLKNGISSRQDALHISWLCGISADVEKDCSYQFSGETISGQWVRFASLVQKSLIYSGQVTGTSCCLNSALSSPVILLLSMETEFALACCFVGMHQSQNRHSGVKERHSLWAQQ